MNLIYNKDEILVYELAFIAESDFLQAEQQLPNFPPRLQEKIKKYPHRLDRCLRIGGKWLLQQIIEDLGLGQQFSLEQLQYTSNNKSHFANQLYFSIGHSGHTVVTAASIHQQLGIDIEEIKPIQLIDYISYLSDKELYFLQKSVRPVHDFYTIWTKKEALAKLIGMGITFNFKEFTVLQNEVQINASTIRFEEIHANPNYKIMLAYKVVNGL
jgi:4'-phosphopantetheinyl transferase